ncbi:MAG: hypothetical protein K5787_08625 [Lentisphaeria bacterium]|nr:hypothetical protein [Lentisphaeria bacterium]
MEDNITNHFKPNHPDRRHPSRNSVKEHSDNRSIILYVTAVTHKRMRVLANDDAHECIRNAWEAASDWLVGRYTVMPDHTHFFCSPGGGPRHGFHQWMQYWKRLSSKSFWLTPTGRKMRASMNLNENERNPPLGQRDCWDRQMRNGESYHEKWNYVRNNPVRAGLVEKAEDWKYQGELHKLVWMEE